MKATHIPAVVKVVETVLEEEKIILELTPLEAKTLGAIFGGISNEDVLKLIERHAKFRFDVSADDYANEVQHKVYNALKNIVGKDGW
jgi:hypothetical protein